MPSTQSQGNPLISLDPYLYKTLRQNHRVLEHGHEAHHEEHQDNHFSLNLPSLVGLYEIKMQITIQLLA